MFWRRPVSREGAADADGCRREGRVEATGIAEGGGERLVDSEKIREHGLRESEK